jgi:hypothetical protein
MAELSDAAAASAAQRVAQSFGLPADGALAAVRFVCVRSGLPFGASSSSSASASSPSTSAASSASPQGPRAPSSQSSSSSSSSQSSSSSSAALAESRRGSSEGAPGLDRARVLLARLKHTSLDKVWRTVLEGALLEARSGRVRAARNVFKYLMEHVPW